MALIMRTVLTVNALLLGLLVVANSVRTSSRGRGTAAAPLLSVSRYLSSPSRPLPVAMTTAIGSDNSLMTLLVRKLRRSQLTRNWPARVPDDQAFEIAIDDAKRSIATVVMSAALVFLAISVAVF